MTRRQLLNELSHDLVRLHVDTPISRDMLPAVMRDTVQRMYQDADMLLWDADDSALTADDVRSRVAVSRYLMAATRHIYTTMNQPDIAERYSALDERYRKALSALITTSE